MGVYYVSTFAFSLFNGFRIAICGASTCGLWTFHAVTRIFRVFYLFTLEATDVSFSHVFLNYLEGRPLYSLFYSFSNFSKKIIQHDFNRIVAQASQVIKSVVFRLLFAIRNIKYKTIYHSRKTEVSRLQNWSCLRLIYLLSFLGKEHIYLLLLVCLIASLLLNN